MNTFSSIPPGKINVLSLDVDYIHDPTAFYAHICAKSEHSLLLDSAEINSKEDLKSIMLIDAALRIECMGRTITLDALSKNGEDLLAHLYGQISDRFIAKLQQPRLSLQVPQNAPALDEDTRLLQTSSLDVLRLIRQSLDLDGQNEMALFMGGLFAYDLVDSFEPLPSVTANNQCPDYLFYVAETLLTIDHQKQHAKLQATLFGGQYSQESYYELSRRLRFLQEQSKGTYTPPQAQKLETIDYTTNISDPDFCDIVSHLKQRVINGDVFQIVPSRQFKLPCPSPLATYQILKESNPSPYMFYLKDSKFTLFGASPESALKYTHKTNEVQISPIAGTRKRGKNPDGSINMDLDSRIEFNMRSDKKEQAEHMMLVDLARNDVARISIAGTRHVTNLLQVDRYSHVMHLVSRVVGKLRPDLDALHAYQACMNMGTLSGAPKVRAMQLIRSVEHTRRGAYGGAVGYLTGAGDLDTCIVIRSAYVENQIATVQAGAGVVYDSIPQSEADETVNKAQAVISAIKKTHLKECK